MPLQHTLASAKKQSVGVVVRCPFSARERARKSILEACSFAGPAPWLCSLACPLLVHLQLPLIYLILPL